MLSALVNNFPPSSGPSVSGLRGRTLRQNVQPYERADFAAKPKFDPSSDKTPVPELKACVQSDPAAAKCSLASNRDMLWQAIASIGGGFVFPAFVFPDSWFGDDLTRAAIGAFIGDCIYVSIWGTQEELNCIYNKGKFLEANPITILGDTALAAGTLLWLLDFIDVGEIFEDLIGFENTGTFTMVVSFLALMTTNLAVAANALRMALVFYIKTVLRLCPVCVPTENEGFKVHNRDHWFDPIKHFDSCMKAWTNFAIDVGEIVINPMHVVWDAFSSLEIPKILLAGFNLQASVLQAFAQLLFDFGTMLPSVQSECCDDKGCCEPDCFNKTSICTRETNPITGQLEYTQSTETKCSASTF